MQNDYGLFFTRDGTVVRLPVNPEKLPVERGSANDEYDVLGIGPIMVPRAPALREVRIAGYFPGKAYAGVLTPNGFQPPEFYIKFFESAMQDRAPILYTPVRYYEDGTPFMAGDPGMTVLVTRFDTEERGGETGDFYYDLTLTEYRDYSPLTMQAQGQGTADTAAQPAAARAAAAAAPTAADDLQPLRVSAQRVRDMPPGRLYVGAAVTANGPYYQDSYGEQQAGWASGLPCTVVRIEAADPARPHPVYVKAEGGPLGWMKKEALQAVKTR